MWHQPGQAPHTLCSHFALDCLERQEVRRMYLRWMVPLVIIGVASMPCIKQHRHNVNQCTGLILRCLLQDSRPKATEPPPKAAKALVQEPAKQVSTQQGS